jgi:hypothetical protein
MTAHASSPLRDEAGTNSDLFARCATKVDLRIATWATRHAAAAIQKIASQRLIHYVKMKGRRRNRRAAAL